jgi:two-component system, OmpR family, response regulator
LATVPNFHRRVAEKMIEQGPVTPACTILLVEDEKELSAEIKLELDQRGYLVRSVSMAEVAEIGRTDSTAILILDRACADLDGLRALEEMRKQGIKIPVLMISALSSADEVAKGLGAGADDYLTKPFNMAEFVARVEALLRRLGEVRPTKLSFDDLEIDLIKQTATRGGKEIRLVGREFKLLEYFLRHPGQIITRAMLLDDLWHFDPGMKTNVVDAQISNLRKKIDDPGQPSRIANVRGMGYMLCFGRRASTPIR